MTDQSQIEVRASQSTSNDWSADHAFKTGGAVLLFGAFLIACITLVALKQNNNNRDLVRLFSVPIIIIAAVYLVVAGYDEKQIAPVIALLSSVAGFILGSTIKPNSE